MKVCVESYGCTANLADARHLEALVRERGHILTGYQEAELVVLNTCTVTGITQQKMLKRLHQIQSDGKKVIVAGCLPAAQPELLPPGIRKITPSQLPRRGDLVVQGVTGVVSISQGCLGNCSYCIVKKARGDLESRPPGEILKVVRGLVSGGAREILLTSQDTAAYGRDLGLTLPDLLEMLTGIQGDFQVRVGMMNPAHTLDILDSLLEVWGDPRIWRFLHLPLQSGSDRVLEDMNRKYTTQDFREIIRRFRERFPEITISTDIITGYPTETEEDFQETIKIIKETWPVKVNITRYSPRPHTPAWKLKDLPERIKKDRSRKLTQLCLEISKKHHQKRLGKETEILLTEREKPGTTTGRDPSYTTVVVKKTLPLGDRLKVKITQAKDTYLVGEPL